MNDIISGCVCQTVYLRPFICRTCSIECLKLVTSLFHGFVISPNQYLSLYRVKIKDTPFFIQYDVYPIKFAKDGNPAPKGCPTQEVLDSPDVPIEVKNIILFNLDMFI